MIRLETLLLLGIGIALVSRSTDGQQVTFPRRSQASNICDSNRNQEWTNCCDGFLMCRAAGAVGDFMRCAEGTLFDDSLGLCNVISDVNHRCHPSNARLCFNNPRQGLRNNFLRNNNNRRPNNPRRSQFRNTNTFNTFPPPFTTNNQNNRFSRFNGNRNQNRFNGNPNQNRFNRNRNQNNRFNRNPNTGFTSRPNTGFTSIPNNRFGRTQNNRFQTNTRNRFNTIRFTTPNGNRGTFQAPERILLTIRDVRPALRDDECIRFQTELNRQFSQLALSRLGSRRVPVLSISCQTRQNIRG